MYWIITPCETPPRSLAGRASERVQCRIMRGGGAGNRRIPPPGPARLLVTKVPRDLDSLVASLKSVERRLDVSDDELVELFWQGHPRFQFFTSLPWSTNLLDL